MTATPALPVEIEQLMRQLKMPYARTLAPELLATAKAQRWEPVDVVRALLVEEVAGRGRSMLASRRTAAAASEEDLAAARKWLQKLDSETIPPSIGDVSFSRSSGPGGQNVNKYRSLGFSYLGNY